MKWVARSPWHPSQWVPADTDKSKASPLETTHWPVLLWNPLPRPGSELSSLESRRTRTCGRTR